MVGLALPLPHFMLLGLPSKEKPPPFVKLIPAMPPYDMGEAPVLDGIGAAKLPDDDAMRGRLLPVGTG